MKYLEKLVNIRSDNTCDQIIDYLKEELISKTKEVKIIEKEDKVLIVGINTQLKNIEPVILSGHIDTVSANEQQYITNPYKLTVQGKKAYGLGSIDMKSFTAIILDKIEEIKKIEMPIILVLTTDEETKLKSIEQAINSLKEMNIKPKITIIGEPTKSEFNLSSNACYEYLVKFYGKACHSSKIQQGVNAICACAKLISFIESRQKQYKLTSNCGVITGGEVVNKVPDFAKITFDVRSIYDKDIKFFMQDIQNYINTLICEYDGLKVELQNELKIPAFNMMENKKIKTIAKQLDIKINSFTGGCEAGYYTQYSGDAIIFGVGDIALAQKPNEYVEIDEYNKYSNKILSVLNEIKKYYY